MDEPSAIPDRTYWLVPGKILAGPYPGSPSPDRTRERIHSLLALGIRTFINLMEASETNHFGDPFVPYQNLLAESGARMHRYPIVDMSTPSPLLMEQILEKIDEELAASRPVYLHCWGGRGRTGTVAGCYLVRSEGISGEEALRRIGTLRAERPGIAGESPETPEQREFVRGWG